MYTKFHGIPEAFSSRDVSHKVQLMNFVRYVAVDKISPNWCRTRKKLSVYTRGKVAARYPWDMCTRKIFKCANVVTDVVPATCPRYTSLLHVVSVCTKQICCRCNMTASHL